jgi:hypothetical protein
MFAVRYEMILIALRIVWCKIGGTRSKGLRVEVVGSWLSCTRDSVTVCVMCDVTERMLKVKEVESE